MPLTKELGSPENEAPPALPPKSYKQRKPTGTPPTIITTPPPSPKPTNLGADHHGEGIRHQRILSGTQGSELMSTVCEELSDLTEEEQMNLHHSHKLPNENVNNTNSWNNHHNNHHLPETGKGVGMAPLCTPDAVNEEDEGIDIVLENHNYNNKKVKY